MQAFPTRDTISGRNIHNDCTVQKARDRDTNITDHEQMMSRATTRQSLGVSLYSRSILSSSMGANPITTRV